MHSFDGDIAGVGTSSGVRLVLGMWTASPFGPIVDAMVQRADGHRILIAPNDAVADFIAATYRFDEVRVEPTTLVVDRGTRHLSSTSLDVRLEIGRRTLVGRLLVLVPRRLARSRAWCRAIDPFARLMRRGVRTTGTAGAGRREWYCALDEHAVTGVGAALDGDDLGELRDVVPAVRFGFASTPPTPAIVAVTTWVSGPIAQAGRPAGAGGSPAASPDA